MSATDWTAIPLVCGKREAALVLNISPRTLNRRLKAGTMQPAPMPRLGRKVQWSRKDLQTYIEGGHRQYSRRG